MGQNDPKTTFDVTHKKSATLNQKFFFECNLLDWPIRFEPLNSSLAQSAEELGRW